MQSLTWAQSVLSGMTVQLSVDILPLDPQHDSRHSVDTFGIAHLMLIFMRSTGIVHETWQRNAWLLAWVHVCISHCI